MNKRIWLTSLTLGLVLFSLLSAPRLHAQTHDLEANKAVLSAFFEAEAARAYGRMDDLFVKNFVRHSVATTAIMPEVKVSSLEEYKQFLKATAAMFPDYYNTPQMLAAEGDRVAFYALFAGSYAENGNPIHMPMAGYVRFEKGKIAEMWIEWDNMTWNTQMTASPVKPTETPISSIDDMVSIWRI